MRFTLFIVIVCIATLAVHATSPTSMDTPNSQFAKEVVQLTIEAIGGAVALRRVEKSHCDIEGTAKGTPMQGTCDIAANKLVFTYQDASQVIAYGFVDDVHWLHHMTEDKAEYTLLSTYPSRFDNLLPFPHLILKELLDHQDELRYIGESVIDDEDCYELLLEEKGGDAERIFISMDSFLLLRCEHTESGVTQSRITNTTTYSNWQQFGDLKLFTEVHMEFPDGETTEKKLTIKLGKADESKLVVPQAVKDILEFRKKAESEAAGDQNGDD